jgi:cbb3-type cytochrome oxidase subunit 3
MSEPAPTATLRQQHYQALCGMALSALILLQLNHSGMMAVSFVVNVLIGGVGILGIFYRARLSPMLVLFAIAAPQVVEQYYLNQNVQFGRGMRFLDLEDVLMCLAALTYFIGHYRLHGLWFGVLPADRRLKPVGAAEPTPPRVRSEESLRPAELVALVFAVPVVVLAAELAIAVLKLQWTAVELPPRWRQFVFAAWTLVLGLFLGAHAFRYWRRAQMDRATALLLLQDVQWHETRGEQRRIYRWIVWKKLRQ